jgi:N-acetylneuraminate synthase
MSRTFIIAEAGVNHNGEIALAKRLIDAAKEAGADAVKFQTWQTELIVTPDAAQARYQSENTGIEESQYEMLKRLELSYEAFRDMKEYCDKRGILFLSTPDEECSADFLSDLQEIFKIGSGELTNIPFLRHIGSMGKEIILSTGMGTLGEVERALDTLEEAGTPRERITLLHATTMYPTPMEEVNLKAMLTLRDAFKVSVGYSDHTMGIEVPIAAAALGAKVIEKHFTLSRNLEGPDHKASLEPHELKAMVHAIRNIESALGDGIKKVQHSERANRSVVRKRIIAKRNIRRHETFTPENLTTKRSDKGIDAAFWDLILQQHANREYREGEPIEL